MIPISFSFVVEGICLVSLIDVMTHLHIWLVLYILSPHRTQNTFLSGKVLKISNVFPVIMTCCFLLQVVVGLWGAVGNVLGISWFYKKVQQEVTNLYFINNSYSGCSKEFSSIDV